MLKKYENNTTLRRLKWMMVLLWFFTCFVLIIIYTCFGIDGTMSNTIILESNMIYILLWTHSYNEPYKEMDNGQNIFLKHNCAVNNCYITTNKYIRKSLLDFDAILFHSRELELVQNLTEIRSPHQIYVFVSIESEQYNPFVNKRFDNFFNWTWTYKLKSDICFGDIVIKNKQGDIIGPKKEMHWLKPEEMEPINVSLIQELSNKNSSVSWLVSKCKTLSKREYYVRAIKAELAKHKMNVDTYGKCGKAYPKHYNDLVKRYNYFYLSFENSFGEDYVTKKLMTALLNNAVPIVYGGANYTRFLPDGAYLDLRKIGIKNVTREIVDAIHNPHKYYDFFKWRNYYSYHYTKENPETNYYCKLCSKLNEQKRDSVNGKQQSKFYKDFLSWWNTPQ